MVEDPRAARRLSDLRLLRKVRDRIDREYAEPLDVESLARGVGLSAGHLSREFRAAYGESPYSYLMTRRIERAMTLLRRGDLSVTEVCFAVGYGSLGTFTTRFTELVGMSPGRYRREGPPPLQGLPGIVTLRVTKPVRRRDDPPTRRAVAAPPPSPADRPPPSPADRPPSDPADRPPSGTAEEPIRNREVPPDVRE